VRTIWQRYFPQLVRIAREKLAGTQRRLADEEDVALSALDRFCRAAQRGHFPDLAGRDELWHLLLRIATRRTQDLAQRERRGVAGRVSNASDPDIRGMGKVEDSAAPEGNRIGRAGGAAYGGFDMAQIRDEGPTPEFAAVMAEECRRLLARLDERGLQELAIAKMEGYSNQEIADKHQCSLRTVERRLHLIREIWRDEEPG
jgi:DNA-directed RNA polymerase specialized sigma24 family protein